MLNTIGKHEQHRTQTTRELTAAMQAPPFQSIIYRTKNAPRALEPILVSDSSHTPRPLPMAEVFLRFAAPRRATQIWAWFHAIFSFGGCCASRWAFGPLTSVRAFERDTMGLRPAPLSKPTATLHPRSCGKRWLCGSVSFLLRRSFPVSQVAAACVSQCSFPPSSKGCGSACF